MNSCPLIPADWELPSVLRFRLGTGPGRQRAMEHDGQMLLVLHNVPQGRQQQRTGQLFWRDPAGTWQSTLGADGGTALERHLDNFSRAIDQLAEDFETAEGSKDFFHLLADLGPLVRATRNLHAALAQARDLMREERVLINWRDEAYGLVRRVELLQGDAKSALDFEIARQTEVQAEASHQMAASAHRLNILAAFFFPLATLSAIFGMQLGHGMENWDKAHQPWLLLGVLVAGLLAGGALTLLVTRPAKRPSATKDTRDQSS